MQNMLCIELWYEPMFECQNGEAYWLPVISNHAWLPPLSGHWQQISSALNPSKCPWPSRGSNTPLLEVWLLFIQLTFLWVKQLWWEVSRRSPSFPGDVLQSGILWCSQHSKLCHASTWTPIGLVPGNPVIVKLHVQHLDPLWLNDVINDLFSNGLVSDDGGPWLHVASSVRMICLQNAEHELM